MLVLETKKTDLELLLIMLKSKRGTMLLDGASFLDEHEQNELYIQILNAEIKELEEKKAAILDAPNKISEEKYNAQAAYNQDINILGAVSVFAIASFIVTNMSYGIGAALSLAEPVGLTILGAGLVFGGARYLEYFRNTRGYKRLIDETFINTTDSLFKKDYDKINTDYIDYEIDNKKAEIDVVALMQNKIEAMIAGNKDKISVCEKDIIYVTNLLEYIAFKEETNADLMGLVQNMDLDDNMQSTYKRIKERAR